MWFELCREKYASNTKILSIQLVFGEGMHTLKVISIAVVTCLLLLFLAVQVERAMDNPDFLVYWLAGNLISRGISPYNESVWSQGVIQLGWFTDQTFLYPLPTGVFFLFWGRLPYRFAYLLWMFLCMVFIFSSLLLLMHTCLGDKAFLYLIPVLGGVVVFRPVLVSIRNGQIGPFLFFVLTITLILWKKQKWLLGGVSAILVLLKPNVGLPILFFSALYLLWDKRYLAFLGMGVGGIGFWGIGWLIDPSWVQKFVHIGERKLNQTFGFSPTLWGVAHQICSQDERCSIPLGILFTLIFVGYFLYFLARHSVSIWDTGGILIPLALLVNPFGWAYEQVLLLVSIIWITSELSHRTAFLIAGLFPLGISVFALALLFLATFLEHDVWSFLVPLLCLFLAYQFVGKKFKKSGLPGDLLSTQG